jgi:RHS repeat-associated protein
VQEETIMKKGTLRTSSRKSMVLRLTLAIVSMSAAFITADLLLPASTAHAYKYDERGRLVAQIRPGGRLTRYHYDRAGLLSSVSYHRVGRLTRWAYPSLTSVKFEHDLAGNRVAMKDRLGQTNYVYDNFNRLTEVIAPSGQKVAYEYDPWNNVRSQKLPGGHTLKNQYDLQGEITEVADAQGSVRYEHDAEHNRLIRRTSDGISTIYEFSQANRLSAIQHFRADASLICAYRYEYDVADRVSVLEEVTPRGTARTTYEYDLANRLKKVSQPDGSTLEYEYDAMGNRIAQTDAHGTTRYAYDAAGRLVKANDTTYTYDAVGNLIAKQSRAGRFTYEYDDENRLVQVSGAHIVRYFYDGDGNRVRREADGKITNYVNDTRTAVPQVLAEYAEGRAPSYYLLGRNRVARRDEHGATIYLLEDNLGSTRCVVDEKGRVLARYAYTPFGAPTLVEGSAQTDFLFAGEQWDEEAQLLYLRSRFYDPHTGRLLSTDPVRGTPAAPATFNQYVYVNNDPINQVDPLGRQGQPPPSPRPTPSLVTTQSSDFNVERRHDTPHIGPTRTEPTNPYDPNRYRPLWIESRQRAMQDWAVDVLSRHPNSFRGYSAAAFSAVDHAILQHVWAPFEPPIRKLMDPDYTYGHPYRTLGAGLEIGWHAATTFLEPNDPRGLFVTFRRGVPFSERMGLYAVNETWAGSRVYLPFIDSVVRNSKTLKVPVDTAWNLYGLGMDSTELVSTLAGNPSFAQSATQITGTALRHNPLLNLVDPFDLRSKSNYFFPPPGGGSGGATMPKVGGVYLDQTARVLGELGAITGAVYDPQTGRLTLVGDKSTTLPPMKPEYLAAALRAVYAPSEHAPGMTIDPNPQDPHSSIMVVRFFGNTENTRLGWVMFEADRVMKSYSIGNDNVTRQSVQSAVPGYQSVTAMALQAGVTNNGLWSRFWLVPEPVTARLSDDGHAVVFDPIRMRVKTETMRLAAGKLVSSGGVQDPAAEAFAAHFTEHYEDYARENPVYAELKQVAQAVALAKWMKQQDVPVDWNFVRVYAGRSFVTPQTTPAAYGEITQTENLGGVIRTRKIMTFGGVDADVRLQPQRQAEAGQLQSALASALPPEGQDARPFDLRFNNQDYVAVALPGNTRRELASYNTTATELSACVLAPSRAAGLPGLVRYYNSLHNEQTEFGFAWSLQLPHLEFEAVGAEGQTQYLSVGGAVNQRVRVQRFTLTNQFGIAEQRFVTHFVDQDSGRIGFKPEAADTSYRGLYPEADGNYRLLFQSGAQAVFDAEGRLRAMFTDEAKALYDYDDGHLSVISYADGEQSAWKVSFEIDGDGRIKAASSDAGRVTYDYDARGDLRLVKCKDQTVAYNYDDRHLLVAISVNDQVIAQNSYDSQGRLTAQRDASGQHLEQSLETTADGRVVSLNVGADAFRLHYDAQDRLTRIEDAASNSLQYTYDETGNMSGAEQTLANGGHATLELFPDHQRAIIRDPRGVQTEYRSNPDGTLAEVWMNDRRLVACHYDGRGKVVEVLYEGGYAEHFAYDAEGRLQQYRRSAPDGGASSADEVTLSYNVNGELAGITGPSTGHLALTVSPDGIALKAGPTSQSVRYAADGRPLRVEGSDGSIATYTYRPVQELEKIEVTKAGRVGSIEFEQGRITRSQSLSGGQFHYAYTPDGLLHSVKGPYEEQTFYFYDSQQRLQRVSLPNGRCLDYAYDTASGRLVQEQPGHGCAAKMD